jgi:uncharacterized protein (DUF1015 family)
VAIVRPFHALRPVSEAAAAVAAVPYDVVSRSEALDLAADNPLSFLHVSRAEIDLDAATDPYDPVVYHTAVNHLETLRVAAPLVVEETASLYFYRLRDGSHEQTGLAGCYSVDEYDRGVIKRHEWTRADKEDDRTRHMLALGAQTGIAFLTYRMVIDVDVVKARACQREPLLDIMAPDGVRHTLWRLTDVDQQAVTEAFAGIPMLYIADGHHRIASAARARTELAPVNRHDPEAQACYFLGVAFPDSETLILPYNRGVTDLAGLTCDEFLAAVKARFPVRPVGESVPSKGQVAMYLDGQWYGVDLCVGSAPSAGDVVAGLDVARLQNQILAPVLKVADVRTDPRMIFVGGVRGTSALEQLVDSGAAAVAFSLAAVTTDELLSVSDADAIMPPKSTWFEPKLRDGLLIHLI